MFLKTGLFCKKSIFSDKNVLATCNLQIVSQKITGGLSKEGDQLGFCSCLDCGRLSFLQHSKVLKKKLFSNIPKKYVMISAPYPSGLLLTLMN